jgi:DNA recombination protein RmuC
MLIVLLVLQAAVLLAVLALVLRKPLAAAPDPLLAELSDRLNTLDSFLREALAQMRRDAPEEASRTRKENADSSTELRKEVVASITTLGSTLKDGLDSFRADNAASAVALRNEVEQKMRSISQGFADLKAETNLRHSALEESLNRKLLDLMASNAAHQDKLRSSVEQSLALLNKDNTAKLEEMRVTVDEKLQSTLNDRLTKSFGQVTTHLGEVQKGLGEMKELATGVGDLKKIFSNVKSRGGIGEFLVGQQLEQMFSPEQYVKQVNIKPGTTEAVDFALKFPNGETGSFVLLPIDAKFPRSDWELLEEANEHGTAEEIIAAGKAFERAIRTQGKKISDKYIDPPTTTPHAIMVLPTEGLYAEVVRRPGLQSELQSTYRVTVAGPSTFMAILTSFQMGFHTLAIQKKGDEVWKVLSKAKNEFTNFGTLMDKVEKQVGTVQNTLGEIKRKTNTINRSLKNVSNLDAPSASSNLLAFDEQDGIAPSLAATSDED